MLNARTRATEQRIVCAAVREAPIGSRAHRSAHAVAALPTEDSADRRSRRSRIPAPDLHSSSSATCTRPEARRLLSFRARPSPPVPPAADAGSAAGATGCCTAGPSWP